MRTAAIVYFTFILIVTLTIVDEKLTLWTGALEAADRIDTCVRTVAVVRLTFVDVDALMLIAAVMESVTTRAHVRADRVDAFVLAAAVVPATLVDIDAFVAALGLSEAAKAEAFVAAIIVATLLCAAAVTYSAFVDVVARLAVVVAFVSWETFAFMCLFFASMSAAAVVFFAKICLNARAPIVTKF